MSRSFREYAEELSPAWLRRKYGAAWIRALVGLLADRLAEGAQRAVLARFPGGPTDQYDALTLAGGNVGIERLPGETAAGYAAVLRTAWDYWGRAGTGTSIVEHFARVGASATCYGLEWEWDRNTDDWSRYWVVVTGHALPEADPWGDNAGARWGNGLLWGFGESAEAVDRVRAYRGILTTWGPAHYRCAGLVLPFPGSAWDGTSADKQWDDATNRPAGAAYLEVE